MEIWVAKGTYYPDEGNSITDNDRLASFNLKPGVAIYGGFAGTAGTEGDFNSRNWKTNATILSGDLMQNDGLNFANNGDNAIHVVQRDGVFEASILYGFTIEGGNANL